MSVNNKVVSSIALPYARALFDVLLYPNKANEDNIDMICLQILSNLSQVVMSPEFYVLISNPKITKDQLLTILVEFVSKFISKNTNNILVETITKLLKLLIANNRIKFIPSIAIVFEQLSKDFRNQLTVIINTPFELTQDNKLSLEAKLSKKFDKSVKSIVNIDKTLIGGIKIAIADKVIDYSINGKLEQMSGRLI